MPMSHKARFDERVSIFRLCLEGGKKGSGFGGI